MRSNHKKLQQCLEYIAFVFELVLNVNLCYPSPVYLQGLKHSQFENTNVVIKCVIICLNTLIISTLNID